MSDSIFLLREAISKAKDGGDRKSLAQAQMVLAKALTVQLMVEDGSDSRVHKEALAVACDAVENAAEAGDSQTEALALNSVGQLLLLVGETAEPLRCFERALHLYRKLGDDSGAASCCQGIASVCVKTGDFSRASEVLRQAVRHSTQAGDAEQIATHKRALAQIGGGAAASGDRHGVRVSPGFFGWYLKVIQNYVGFSGRAGRAEFWSFTAVNFLVFFVLGFLEGALGINNDPNVFILGGLYNLAIIIPTLAVTVRRFHDTGQSGWCVLINVIPIVGWLVVLYLLAQRGEETPNTYGPPPSL